MKKNLLDKAIFAGCVRNCENWLPKVLTNIEKYSSYFLESHFIFIENDSTDRTKDILKKCNYSNLMIENRIQNSEFISIFYACRTIHSISLVNTCEVSLWLERTLLKNNKPRNRITFRIKIYYGPNQIEGRDEIFSA